MTADSTSFPVDSQVGIDPVHLKVTDLERTLHFYCGVSASS